jgi:UDP-hydrolysing UDP-N-acetyl-D-glucosamine 2-epimerase
MRRSEISNLKSQKRRVCFVTGTRAEFGLMERTLRAIQSRPGLELQLVVTGMHLDRRHGRTIDEIRKRGWRVDATVPWKPAGSDLASLAEQTGVAGARLARVFERLRSDIVMVVGDRVEAFAAASAGHLSGRVVAHVHGGDRAQGQVDDALRHAITMLAHVHFAATRDSAERIVKLGEDLRRVHVVGSPGLDGILEDAASQHRQNGRFGLMVLHPTSPDQAMEERRTRTLLRACNAAGLRNLHIVLPNNDPGASGIIRALKRHANGDCIVHDNLVRPHFLGLLRDADVLVGNSSAGIIEAASFGTPVIDVGDRQKGRLRGENVTNVPFRVDAIRSALQKYCNGHRPTRFPPKNPYGRGDTGRRIAQILARIPLDERSKRKLIAY